MIIIVRHGNNCPIFPFPLQARDAGGSMVIHTFGAYYGLAISWMLYRPHLEQSSRLQGSVYHSDVFAMIGMIGGPMAAGCFIAQCFRNVQYMIGGGPMAAG